MKGRNGWKDEREKEKEEGTNGVVMKGIKGGRKERREKEEGSNAARKTSKRGRYKRGKGKS